MRARSLMLGLTLLLGLLAVGVTPVGAASVAPGPSLSISVVNGCTGAAVGQVLVTLTPSPPALIPPGPGDSPVVGTTVFTNLTAGGLYLVTVTTTGFAPGSIPATSKFAWVVIPPGPADRLSITISLFPPDPCRTTTT